MKEVYDYIIVGAGTAGGVLSYNLTKSGAKCHGIDQSPKMLEYLSHKIKNENIQ